MKIPVFASGTLANLKTAIKNGRISYPAFCWLTDSTQYSFVNKDNKIEIVGNPSYEGTLDDPLILSTLPAGKYDIRGYYKITENYSDEDEHQDIELGDLEMQNNTVGAVYMYPNTTLVIVESYNSGKKIKVINAHSIVDYSINLEGEVTKVSHYSTEGGGGGGVTSYLDLDDKPTLNNVVIKGDMTSEDLIPLGTGLVYDNEGKIALSYEEVSNPSGGTTVTIGS